MKTAPSVRSVTDSVLRTYLFAAYLIADELQAICQEKNHRTVEINIQKRSCKDYSSLPFSPCDENSIHPQASKAKNPFCSCHKILCGQKEEAE